MKTNSPKSTHSIIAIDIYPKLGNKSPDWICGMQEWESEETLNEMTASLEEIGHSVTTSGNPQNLVNQLSDLRFQEKSILVWNLVEGYKSRNREAYIPAICEFLGIPCTGSDAYAQNMSLDKHLTKEFLRSYINLAPGNIVNSDTFGSRDSLNYPLFVKPRGEGSGLGVWEGSILKSSKDWEYLIPNDDSESNSKLNMNIDLDGNWIYERYLSGTEYTVCMLQEDLDSWLSVPAKLSYPHSVYGEEVKIKDSMPETFELDLPNQVKRELQDVSLKIVRMLRAEGYARLDFKESEGKIYFLEINLTPGLSNIYSLFPKILRSSMGWEYKEILERIASISWKNFQHLKRYHYGRNQNSRLC